VLGGWCLVGGVYLFHTNRGFRSLLGVSQTPTLKNSVKSQKGQPRYLGCVSSSRANAPLHLWCDGAYMFLTHTCVCATETARPPRARAGSLVSPSKPTKFPLPYIYTGKKGANPGNGMGTGRIYQLLPHSTSLQFRPISFCIQPGT
jgi:hypothetical protein